MPLSCPTSQILFCGFPGFPGRKLHDHNLARSHAAPARVGSERAAASFGQQDAVTMHGSYYGWLGFAGRTGFGPGGTGSMGDVGSVCFTVAPTARAASPVVE